MFKNKLYSEVRRTENDVTVALCPESSIYSAHFPGNPITPGACLTQMAVELAEQVALSPLTLREMKNVKYLAVVKPSEVKELTFSYSKICQAGEDVTFNVVVKAADSIYSKMSLTCRQRR